jgi:hypothetical protein
MMAKNSLELVAMTEVDVEDNDRRWSSNKNMPKKLGQTMNQKMTNYEPK